MGEYSPEVQELMDEISAQLKEAIEDTEGQTIEEQAEIIEKSLSDMLTSNDVPNEVKVTPREDSSGIVDIEVTVPTEWAWIFEEKEEEDE